MAVHKAIASVSVYSINPTSMLFKDAVHVRVYINTRRSDLLHEQMIFVQVQD